MKSNYLLPNTCKTWGWGIFGLGILLWLILVLFEEEIRQIEIPTFVLYSDMIFTGEKWFQIVKTDISLTLIYLFTTVGSLLLMFSKEKIEDEFIAQLRLRSLQWSILVIYGLFLIANLLIYGLLFLNIIAIQLLILPIIYTIRFHYVIYKHKNTISDEE